MDFGEKVKAYPLDESGPVVGFFVEGQVGDGKDTIQVGAAKHQLAYRDPSGYDESGPNGTYCSLHA